MFFNYTLLFLLQFKNFFIVFICNNLKQKKYIKKHFISYYLKILSKNIFL